MSKTKKKKTKRNADYRKKNITRNVKPDKPLKVKKKIKKSKIIIACSVIFVALCAAAAIIIVNVISSSLKSQLYSSSWVSTSATDSSGDEADLYEIYDNYTSTYQGTLSFSEDGTFSLWLSPGDSSDGTHSGKYNYDGSKISVTYDDGTEDEFEIISGSDGIETIVVGYDEYSVCFTKQTIEPY